MAGPEKWSWSASNGSASAAQMKAAYQAITTGGRTADFATVVWDDIIDHISNQRQSWGDSAWDKAVLDLAHTKMTDAKMTATRFNSAVRNMPPIKQFAWSAELGRTEIKKGDRCCGVYFIYLTDGLNHWIELVPIPFEFKNSVILDAEALGDLCPTIPAYVNEKFEWVYSLTSHVAPALHVSNSLSVLHETALNIGLYTVEAVRIVLFGNVDMDCSADIATSIPTKFGLAIKAEISTGVCCGDLRYTAVDIYSTSSLNVSYSILRAAGAACDVASNFIYRSSVSAIIPKRITADLEATHGGEAWIRELESIRFKGDLSLIQAVAARLSANKTLNLQGHIGVTTSGGVVLTYGDVARIAAVVNAEIENSAKIATLNSVNWTANTTHSLFAKAAFSADTLSMSVLARENYVLLSNATMRFFEPDFLVGSTNFQSAFVANVVKGYTPSCICGDARYNHFANAVLSFNLDNDIQYIKARVNTTHSLFAKAAFSADTLSMGATDKYLTTVSSTFDLVRGLKFLGGTFSDQFYGTASAYCSRQTVDLLGEMNFSSEGVASVLQVRPAWLGINDLYRFDGKTNSFLGTSLLWKINKSFKSEIGVHFDSGTTTPIRSTAVSAHTGTATMSMIGLTLVSDLEDVLVTDLDDMTITEVEFNRNL